jgi:hypothetical protein
MIPMEKAPKVQTTKKAAHHGDHQLRVPPPVSKGLKI